jgi:ABC-type bacteriocin/lantibiotic exporter with double-glycine peptidase domain
MAAAHLDCSDTEQDLEAVADISFLLGMTCQAVADAASRIGCAASAVDGMTWQQVEQALEANHPVIALVDPSQLYLGFVGSAGHFVVIAGLEADSVVFHDPDLGAGIAKARDTFARAWAESGSQGVIVHGSR